MGTADQDKNRAAYSAQGAALAEQHPGKYALFFDGALVDVFDSVHAAYLEGLNRFKLEPFYVGSLSPDPRPEKLPALQHGLIRARIH